MDTNISKKNSDLQFLEKLLTEMFKIRGLKFTKDFCKQEMWYKKYTWNKQEEDKFKEYFIKEHIKYFKSSKKQAEIDFEWFNLLYGWMRNDL